MSDIAASERRLIGALDRIDRCLDASRAGRAGGAETGAADEVAMLWAENARLSDALEALRAEMAAVAGAIEARLDQETEADR